MLKYILLAILICIIDQCIKLLIMSSLVLGSVVPVIPTLNLTLAYNYGAAFGVLSEAGGWQLWLFLASAVLVSVGIVFWMKHSIMHKKKLECFALSLILGGAAGNFIDRVIYGRVIDYLDFYIKDWHWYTFNFADSAICVGAFFILVDCLLIKKKKIAA